MKDRLSAAPNTENCSKKNDNVLCSYDGTFVIIQFCALRLFLTYLGEENIQKNAASKVFCADTENRVCFHKEFVPQLPPSANSIYVQL